MICRNNFVNNNKREIINWNNCWVRFFGLLSSFWCLESTENISFSSSLPNNNNNNNNNNNSDETKEKTRIRF
jgi:hypothetical protein